MWYGVFKRAGAKMAKIYSRVTKINNVVGRNDYISSPDHQEFIKLTGKPREPKKEREKGGYLVNFL